MHPGFSIRKMNINRYNYEEYFILYADNELDREGREQVELFIQQNPDLAAELDILRQTKFSPDTDIIFEGKDSLMKAVINPAINSHNYEEWLMLYTDNELNAEERVMVEKFAAANPSVQKELELFQKTKSLADNNIVFPDKEFLYRREEKVRVLYINWKRIAVAAALLFAVSTVGYIAYNNNNGNGSSTAPVARAGKTNQPGQKQLPANPGAANENTTETAAAKIQEPDNNSISTPVMAATKNKEQVNDVAVKKDNKIVPVKGMDKSENDRNDNMAMIDEHKSSDEEVSMPVMKEINKQDAQLAANVSSKDVSDLLNKDNQAPRVTSEVSHPLYTTTTPVNEPEENKGSVRGFLRRVTRTIEKTTNIKATDEDRLLVGGLAIKL